MDSYGAEGGGSRSESRERRSDSQHSKGKSRKDSRNKSNNFSRGGTNWQRHESAGKTHFSAHSDSFRHDIRPKVPTLKGCEGIHLNNKRQNRGVKAECFVNLVYEDERPVRRERSTKNSIKKSSSLSARRAVYTTEKYMQANCQFVVNNSSSALTMKLREDPDYAPPWNTISEVRLISSCEPNCPICLNKPVARRITTCGHLFCLPCLIHYFTVQAEMIVPCPICFAKIDISCIKPVSIIHCIDFAIGDSISLVLSRCRKGTTLVEQVEADSSALRLSNVVFATRKEMIDRLETDKTQLQSILNSSSEADADESVFIKEALKVLESDMFELAVGEEVNSSVELVGDSPPKPENIVYYVDALHDKGPEATVESAGESAEKSRLESPLFMQSNVPAVAKAVDIDNGYTYFYQSMDGQRIYLNSFNVKCLQKQYGHLSQCPPHIEGKIIGIDYVSVTAEVRSQFRYLAHLPLYSHFQSAEIELDNVLSVEVFQQFEGEIRRRKAERALKQTKEDAYSRRAETLMQRINKVASGVTPLALDEPLVYDHAAVMADSPSLFSVSTTAADGTLNTEGMAQNSESPGGGLAPWTSSSFAKILTEGRSLDTDFPTLGSPPSIPPSPAAVMLSSTAPNSRASSRIANQVRVNSASPSPFAKVTLTKWPGNPATGSSTGNANEVKPPEESTPEEEDELSYAAPEQPRTLADCLANFTLAESPSSGGGGSKKKSKKKSEARLLFSSGRGHALLN